MHNMAIFVRQQQSGENPRSEHVQVCVFQLIIFSQLGFSIVLIIYLLHASLLSIHLTVKYLRKLKMRENKPTLLQGFGEGD